MRVQSKRRCESHESCVCIVGFPACGCQKKSVVYETESRRAAVHPLSVRFRSSTSQHNNFFFSICPPSPRRCPKWGQNLNTSLPFLTSSSLTSFTSFRSSRENCIYHLSLSLSLSLYIYIYIYISFATQLYRTHATAPLHGNIA